MTLTRDDVVSQMTPVFKAASMRRRRFWWYWSSEEIAWAFRVEKLPYGNRIGMDLMCAPLVSGFETPATLKGDDYPLVIFSPDWNIDPNVNIQMLEDLGCAVSCSLVLPACSLTTCTRILLRKLWCGLTRLENTVHHSFVKNSNGRSIAKLCAWVWATRARPHLAPKIDPDSNEPFSPEISPDWPEPV